MMTMMVQMMAYLKILELELLMTMIWRRQLTDDNHDGATDDGVFEDTSAGVIDASDMENATDR